MAFRIEIVPHDPNWPVEFGVLAAALRGALGPLALRIDHIGSTSVPELPAKDIIDIQVTVADLDADAIRVAVSPIGYVVRDDIVGDHVPPGSNDTPSCWAKVYLHAPGGQRPTHVHLRRDGYPNQRYALLFRDYLRANMASLDAYAQVKRALARLHPDDPDAYYDVKDPICDLIMDAAELWAAATKWRPGESDA